MAVIRLPFSIELRRATLRLPSGRLFFEELDHTFLPGLTGLIGANGAGKSMLARLLSGALEASSGRVVRHGTLACVAQEVTPGPEDAVATLAGLGPLFAALERMQNGAMLDTDADLLAGHWTLPADFRLALQDCGLPHLAPGDPALSLSGGERMRVALAGAFLSGADGLILDEPSNHLDRAGREWLLASLRRWNGAAIVVSHDRELLEVMDRIVELDTHGLHSYGGNYSHFRSQRDALQAGAEAALDHARKERAAGQRALQRQQDAQLSRSSRNARAAKDANMPKISLGLLRNRAEGFAGREAARRDTARAELDQAVRDAAARITRQQAVAIMLPDTQVAAGKRILELADALPPWPDNAAPLDLALSGPVRLAVTGPNGCGKSTLLRMFAGQIPPRAGTCMTAVPTAWLDQHAHALLPPQMTVLERLRQLDSPLPEGILRSHLALLGLGAAQVQTPSASLSGGERLKAALACALWRRVPAQLLLLDEPTNHLDLASVEALEQALDGYPGALAIASHDARFLDALSITHTLQWEAGRWRLHER
ncbi:ABC-F family ATP-binding cassette domain-containing protein [Massilia endophytica]|uniref:ABC-F family ATP-binding cassette domain-containing protein n=1 Tax=Massilia endophytica TaxID=2899220 RepID=UPI001E4E582A|nr:ABC-F family ATP-binding cassette domain-containing protein [Massilia endophytica]UGQ48659.1 ATP-binding cassette domain-containing protein [Massilia endophytica]